MLLITQSGENSKHGASGHQSHLSSLLLYETQTRRVVSGHVSTSGSCSGHCPCRNDGRSCSLGQSDANQTQQVKHVLEAYETGRYAAESKCTEEKYSPVYDEIVNLLGDLEKSREHWVRFTTTLGSWAEEASLINGITPVRPTTGLRLHLD
jgi:hypothetical protein